MSLFDDNMLNEEENYKRHTEHLANRLNDALRDLNVAGFNESLAHASDAGAFVVLFIPAERADRFVRDIEDLSRIPT